MQPDELFTFLIFIIGAYFLLILAAGFLRSIIFFFQPLFFQLSKLQWFLQNPIRGILKNIHSSKPRGFFVFLSLTDISIAWWLLVYFVTIPLRVITAIYYDILRFSAVSFADNIQEFLHPKRGKLGHTKGIKFVFLYLILLPYSFVKMIINSALYLADSLLMFAVSIVFPTLTMLHGTKSRKAGTKIVQSGGWRVGEGNYAGTGIYFGLSKKTAKHYAPTGQDKSIVIARVTLTFCKTIAALKQEERDLIGLGEKGEQLAKTVKGFYSSVEHWREGCNWWEYCILKPGKMDQKVSSWRIRAVALMNNKKIVRTYGGFSHYCMSGGLIAGIFSWIVIIFTLNVLAQ